MRFSLVLLVCFIATSPCLAVDTVMVNSNGVIVYPVRFISSNDLATVTAVNASNAVLNAAIGTKASTNETAALGVTNVAQDIAIALRATIAQLAAASAADRVYADGLTDPNALTNGVGSGCTVTTTGKTFYVYVVAPTGTAASVDVDLQDHKTNATAHATLLTSLTNGLTPDDTTWRASTDTWNTVTNKVDTSTLASYVQTNDFRLTNNRTDGAAWHYGDSVTGAVDGVARGLTNYDAYGSALAVRNSFTNAAALAVTALQAEADTLATVLTRGNIAMISTSTVSMVFPEVEDSGISRSILFQAAPESRNFAMEYDGRFRAGSQYFLYENGSGTSLTGVLHPGDSNTNLVNGAGYVTNNGAGSASITNSGTAAAPVWGVVVSWLRSTLDSVYQAAGNYWSKGDAVTNATDSAAVHTNDTTYTQTVAQAARALSTNGVTGVNSLGTGFVNGQATNVGALTPWTGQGYLTNVTTAQIMAAGAVTNAINDPYMTSSNILGNVSGTTCTITRAWGNSLRITPTNTVYFTADSTMTDTNAAVGFQLDIFYNNSTFGFVSAVMTNTATLTSNAWNNIIFWKGYGSSNFIGK